jgi:hypothetical protein
MEAIMNKIVKSFYIIKTHGIVYFFKRLWEYLAIKLLRKQEHQPSQPSAQEQCEKFIQTNEFRPTQKKFRSFSPYSGSDKNIIAKTIETHKADLYEIFISEHKYNGQ